MKWVKLKKYCELSGDTIGSARSKQSRGYWLDGVHYKIGPDGKVWINIEAVEEWVVNGNKAIQSQ